jgi:hypothetical protein
MRCRLDRVVVAATALVVGLSAMSAVAMDLVPGGYGAEGAAIGDRAALTLRQNQFTASTENAGLTLDFTPRASGSLFSRPAALDEGSTTSLSLGFEGRYGEELRLGTIGLTGQSTAATDGLALGGALSVDEWEISGSVGRANLLGTDADVFSAGLGYGRVNARLVYGQLPQSTSGVEGDLLMFSTDLAAWSGLTLEGDVAVSDTLADEPLTVGRIGLRLNF